MNCPSRELLLEQAAGRLEGEAAEKMARHMTACAECRAWLASQAELWAALDGWEAPPVSADFDRRLNARLERVEERQGWWAVFRLRPALSLALAAMLVVAAVLLERPKAPAERGRRPAAVAAIANKPAGGPAVQAPETGGTVEPQTAAELDPNRLEQALDDAEMLRQM